MLTLLQGVSYYFIFYALTLQVRLEDVNATSFKHVLEYLYTDTCPDEGLGLLGVLKLSDQFLLERLKTLCEYNISIQIEKKSSYHSAENEYSINIFEVLSMSAVSSFLQNNIIYFSDFSEGKLKHLTYYEIQIAAKQISPKQKIIQPAHPNMCLYTYFTI